MIYRYFSILLALAVTLGGIQLPGFINQYENRVSAHLLEVRANLAGFQAIADRRHSGSLPALIEHHRNSSDATFREEADVITMMVSRHDRFQAQLNGLDGSLFDRISHLLFAADTQLIQETSEAYTWTVTFNREALICGIISLVIGLGLSDLIRLLVPFAFRRSASTRSNSG